MGIAYAAKVALANVIRLHSNADGIAEAFGPRDQVLAKYTQRASGAPSGLASAS